MSQHNPDDDELRGIERCVNCNGKGYRWYHGYGDGTPFFHDGTARCHICEGVGEVWTFRPQNEAELGKFRRLDKGGEPCGPWIEFGVG